MKSLQTSCISPTPKIKAYLKKTVLLCWSQHLY
jgi:hypothetical protein